MIIAAYYTYIKQTESTLVSKDHLLTHKGEALCHYVNTLAFGSLPDDE